jgi:biopolymer transport protein ExbB
MALIERFNSLVALGASWVLWLLIALSLVGMSIIVERAICFFSTREDVPALQEELEALLTDGNLQAVENRLQESASFEARVVASVLRAPARDAANDRLDAESTRVRIDMERHLAFLGTVGSNAPFVGLLGTVIGIVGAFNQLDVSGGQLSSGLRARIGEALVATAVGIFVALPAVAAFNTFQRIVRARVASGEALARDVVARLFVVVQPPAAAE